MVELLVTLVLIGLIASVVAPGLDSWLSSRNAASLRMAVSGELGLLPLRASRGENEIVISQFSQLQLNEEFSNKNVQITKPITVLENGFCLGGEFSITRANRTIVFDVTSPYCEVKRVEN